MFSYRDVTLFGSNAIFLGIGAALYLYPEWAVVIFPIFSLIYFWSDFRLDEEIHVIFMFMATAAALFLISATKDTATRAALAVELAGVWMISLGLGFHRAKLNGAKHKSDQQGGELDGQLRDLERDLKFYSAFEASAANQIRLRRDMTDAAKSLGTTLDPKEAQMRLIKILESRYKGSRAKIVAGQPTDALISWATTTRASVLVKDVATDERFRGQPAAVGFKSAVVAPLWVMKRPYAFLRLEHDKPGTFTADDLRAVDLYATLTSLTLENIQFFESVNDLATHDALTQLFTHKAFQNRMQEELLRAGRSQQAVSVIMCDVDHFKKYNDTYGHQAGDMLLQKVAQILTNHVRPVDFVARYGGEEFGIILPAVVRAQAVDFANRIRMKVEAEPFVFQGQRTKVTMSFGVSSFPQDATTHSQLIRAADERLYKAKHGGRNQVVG